MGKWSNLTNIFQMGWNHQLEQLFNQSDRRWFFFTWPGSLPVKLLNGALEGRFFWSGMKRWRCFYRPLTKAHSFRLNDGFYTDFSFINSWLMLVKLKGVVSFEDDSNPCGRTDLVSATDCRHAYLHLQPCLSFRWDVSRLEAAMFFLEPSWLTFSNTQIHHKTYNVEYDFEPRILFMVFYISLDSMITCNAIPFRFPAPLLGQVCALCPTHPRAVYRFVQTGIQRKVLWDVVMEPFDTWCNKWWERWGCRWVVDSWVCFWESLKKKHINYILYL